MAKKSSDSKQVFTYHTRLSNLNVADEVVLCAYAKLFGQVERKLFAELEKAKTISSPDISIKNSFLIKFGLTSRQYNSVSYGLRGKIDSIKALRDDYVDDIKVRITQAEKVVAKLVVNLNNLLFPEKAKKKGARSKDKVIALTPAQRAAAISKTKFKLHYKKRRVALLQDRLKFKIFNVENDKINICFGSNKLFNRQYSLIESGYMDAIAFEKATDERKLLLTQQAMVLWRADWQASRSNQFFVMGSGDEFSGCQGCTAEQESDGSLTLSIRLPKQLESTHGKHIKLTGINFNHGHDIITHATTDYKVMPRNDGTEKTAKSTGFKRVGTALSYRFLKDEKGWRVFVSVGIKPKETVTSKQLGAISIDINADHLAMTEIDRFGNWIDSERYNTHTYGASTDQVEAILGDIAKVIATKAFHEGKPVIIEKLDFSKKKAELSKTDPRYARMLSSFTYGKVISMIRSACFKLGVEVVTVNPAYTSTIGAVNFAQRLGISIHQGAAMAIARRGLGFSERPIESKQSTLKNKALRIKGQEQVATAVKPVIEPTATVKNTGGIKSWRCPKKVRASVSLSGKDVFSPCHDGAHVTLELPVRNRTGHVWCQWGKIRALLKAAHVARVRSGVQKWNPVPLKLIYPSLCTNWVMVVKTQYASQEHCSPDVMSSELPF